MGARSLSQCLAALLVALVIGPPADAGAASPSPPAQARVCTVAGELVQHGQPGRALELIRRARSKASASQAERKCALQYAAARRHRARARVLVDWIETLQARDPVSLASYIQRTAPRTCGQSLKSIATAELTEKQAVDAALGRALRCDRANARARALAKLPPAGTSRICTAARGLIVGGEPQRALDLITKARDTASSDKGKRRCARHYAAALRRQGTAEALVLWVEGMQRQQDDATGPQEVPRPPATCGGSTPPTPDTLDAAIAQGVTWALECDQSSTRALAIKKDLGKESKTRPEQLSSAWDDLKEKYLEPWSGLLTAFLLWMVGSLLIVRLFPRLLHNRYLVLLPDASGDPDAGGASSQTAARWWWQVCGWAFVALGGFLATFKVAQADDVFGGMIAFGVVLTVFGVALLDQAAGRLRDSKADASGDGVAADHVRALLHMGTRPPRGLEVPSGTDATFLKDVGISSDSTNPVVQAVAWLISVARPICPWQLKVQGKTRRRAQCRALPQP